MLCLPKGDNYDTLIGENGVTEKVDPANAEKSGPGKEANGAGGGGPRRGARFTGRGRDGGEHGTATCPTCDGHGKVPKEKERNLLALIPADDERLKVRSRFFSSSCFFPRSSFFLLSSSFLLSPFLF